MSDEYELDFELSLLVEYDGLYDVFVVELLLEHDDKQKTIEKMIDDKRISVIAFFIIEPH